MRRQKLPLATRFRAMMVPMVAGEGHGGVPVTSEPMRTQLLHGLDAHMPRWLLQAASGEAEPLRPWIRPLRATALFADISGFSRLTRIYQDKGDEGVEELSLIISEYLGRLIDCVFAWGGDIENIYGDAILAFWPETATDPAAATRLTLGCSADIVRRHDNHIAPGGVALRIRAAVVAGDLCAVQAGGGDGEWIFMLAGDCLGEIPPLLRLAQPGQVGIAGAIRAALPLVPEIATPRLLSGLIDASPTQVERPAAPLAAEAALLHAFLPGAMRRRGSLRSEWLAEFRWLAMLCVGMPGLRCTAAEDLAATQQAVQSIQDQVARFEGALIRVSASDKGPMAMIAFGLPDQAHDDDAVRAVRAAQEIQLALARQGSDTRCTVTFGLAYCGVVGNRDRHVYTTMGDAVNRAAKLLDRRDMPALLCDAAIVRMTSQRIVFEQVDGSLPDGAALFRPIEYRDAAAPVAGALIDRVGERAWLRQRLSQLGTPIQRPVVHIDGPPGIGKSALVGALAAMTEGQFPCLRGAADPLAGIAEPFAAWGPVFAAAFAADVIGPELCEAQLRTALGRQGLPQDHAALAGAVLPAMRAPARAAPYLPPEDMARVTCETLAGLLRDRIGGGVLIVIEDVHRMDSASWLLAGHVARLMPGVLLVLVSRSDTAAPLSGMRALAASIAVERLALAPLDRDSVADVIADVLGCREIAPELLGLIQERAVGNPLFARQLALALRDQGALSLRDGVCRLTAQSADAAPLQIPESIQRTMVARVDRLPAELQLTLKAASVIGTTFSYRALTAAIGTADLDADECLTRLVEIGMIGVLRPGADPLYGFDHALTQEAVYQLLPFEQRRRLHTAVAEFFEAEPEGNRPAPTLLGLHWSRANRPDRALPYWETAGTAALAGGVYREAVMALGEALAAIAAIEAAPGAEAIDANRAGELHRLRGEALMFAGEVPQSIHHLTIALAKFGFRWSDGVLGSFGTFARHALMQTMVEWRRPVDARDVLSRLVAQDVAADRVRQSALALETLGQGFGHQSKLAAMATATLAAVNLSQRAGDGAIYSRSAGLLSLVFLLSGMPGLAERYLARARRTSPDLDNPHDRLMTIEYIALFLLTAGRLAEVEAELRGMLTLAAASHNRRRKLDATSLLILTLTETGAYADGAELAARFKAEADQAGDPQLRCWARLEAAGLALCGDDIATAEHRLFDASDLLGSVGRNERIWTLGLLALVHLRRGRTDEALAHARQVMGALADWRSLGFYVQAGVFGAAEVFLERLATGGRLGFAQHLEIRRMMRRVKCFGMRQPLTRPRALLLLARYAELRGRDAHAMALTEQAAAEAARLQLPAASLAARAALERLKLERPKA
jgi:class 3 adenylate cyclase